MLIRKQIVYHLDDRYYGGFFIPAPFDPKSCLNEKTTLGNAKSLFPERAIVAYSSQEEAKEQIYRVYELHELSTLWKAGNFVLPGRCLSKVDHITHLLPILPLVLCELVTQYIRST